MIGQAVRMHRSSFRINPVHGSVVEVAKPPVTEIDDGWLVQLFNGKPQAYGILFNGKPQAYVFP